MQQRCHSKGELIRCMFVIECKRMLTVKFNRFSFVLRKSSHLYFQQSLLHFHSHFPLHNYKWIKACKQMWVWKLPTSGLSLKKTSFEIQARGFQYLNFLLNIMAALLLAVIYHSVGCVQLFMLCCVFQAWITSGFHSSAFVTLYLSLLNSSLIMNTTLILP